MQKKWLMGIMAGIAATLVIGLAVVAAMTLTHTGSVQVVASGGTGGGGGGGTPLPSYTFSIYDSASGGNEILNNAPYFELGTINANSYVEKTVYVQRTGTLDVTVTPSVNGLDTSSGAITFTPASVTATASGRQAIVIRFTAGPNPTPALDAFEIKYAGSP